MSYASARRDLDIALEDYRLRPTEFRRQRVLRELRILRAVVAVTSAADLQEALRERWCVVQYAPSERVPYARRVTTDRWWKPDPDSEAAAEDAESAAHHDDPTVFALGIRRIFARNGNLSVR